MDCGFVSSNRPFSGHRFSPGRLLNAVVANGENRNVQVYPFWAEQFEKDLADIRKYTVVLENDVVRLRYAVYGIIDDAGSAFSRFFTENLHHDWHPYTWAAEEDAQKLGFGTIVFEMHAKVKPDGRQTVDPRYVKKPNWFQRLFNIEVG